MGTHLLPLFPSKLKEMDDKLDYGLIFSRGLVDLKFEMECFLNGWTDKREIWIHGANGQWEVEFQIWDVVKITDWTCRNWGVV